MAFWNKKNKAKNTVNPETEEPDIHQEEELVDEIKKMYNAETYQKAIENDISNLNKEKQLLYSEQKEIFEKQNSLKSMAKVLSLLIVSLFVLFIVISSSALL